ncbi:uncharacterized protein [Amphiura filiformis]|uniref:uncharacterized protein n=1 Tax=Amphiura filiformis TaxID=82378 RepID=UPI003B20FB83
MFLGFAMLVVAVIQLLADIDQDETSRSNAAEGDITNSGSSSGGTGVASWGSWGSWGSCSQTCDTGTKNRTRTCSDRGSCSGSATDSSSCNTQSCPSWQSWGPWGTCSRTCGNGTKIRTRTCSCPAMSPGSWDVLPNICPSGSCIGSTRDSSSCNTQSCPSWRSWGSWSSCSRSCGRGTKTRTRTCSGNGSCSGSARGSSPCITQRCGCSSSEFRCPDGRCINRSWLCDGDNDCGDNSDETHYSCRPVGGCLSSEFRCTSGRCIPHALLCDNGNDCGDNSDETHYSCRPVASWGSWSYCSRTCGTGIRTRTRTCSEAGSCSGSATEMSSCNPQNCRTSSWSSWSSWSTCSKSCGRGTKTRTRFCSSFCRSMRMPRGSGSYGRRMGHLLNTCPSGSCSYSDTAAASDSSSCNTRSCPSWMSWGSWSTCSKTCGSGMKIRTRTCSGSDSCSGGSATDLSSCNPGSCVSVFAKLGGIFR